MRQDLLVTLEILCVIVGPLLFLYVRGPWPLRATVPCLVALPLLWYLTYAPLHELSHALGARAVGGGLSSAQWIPRFWRGEFGQAWITPTGLGTPWQWGVMTAFPYLLDGISLALGWFLSRLKPPTRAFPAGVALTLLSLRPTFDLVCEGIAYLRGHRGDLFHLAAWVGRPILALAWILALVLAFASVADNLRHAPRGHEKA